MSKKKPTAEDVWDLLQRLSEEQKDRFWWDLARTLRRTFRKPRGPEPDPSLTSSGVYLPPVVFMSGRDQSRCCELSPTLIVEIFGLLLAAAEDCEKHFKEARDRKPRFKERDAEIVWLKDEMLENGKHRSFGKILRLIEPRWPLNEKGKPLTEGAVKEAYRRAKSNPEPQN